MTQVDSFDEKTEQSRRVVKQLYGFANVDGGDTVAMREIMADDTTLEEAPSHPCPGYWVGRDAVLEATPKVISGINMLKTEVVEWMGNGNRIAALIRITSTDKDGQPFSYDCLEMWKVNDDGKICECRPFYHDLVALRERLGLD